MVVQMVKNLPAMQKTCVWSLSWEDPLEKEMTTHSSILPRKFYGQRSLAGYSPWSCKESGLFRLTMSIIPSTDGPNRIKKVKEELSLFLRWEVHLFQLSDIRFPGSLTLDSNLDSRAYPSTPRCKFSGQELGLGPSAPLVLRPWAWTQLYH